jgi:[ribosomal protein S18]-alanine N-acetyltransferase
MSAGLTIRPMTAADLAELLPLAASLEHVPHWTQDSWLAAIRPPHFALLALQGSTIVGFAVTAVTADVAELLSLAVVPASRRQGVARQLFAAILQQLHPSAIQELWLEVRVSNEPAIRLYRTLGFEETGRRARYYSAPVEDALLMRLRLYPGSCR